MFSVPTKGCHVGYSREFLGTVYCTYRQSNTTNVLPLVYWREYGNLSTRDITIRRATEYQGGIAMLSVNKFPYPRKQTSGNELIPCSNDVCHILKRFCGFKIPAIRFIWPESLYKQCQSVASQRQGKCAGSGSPLWRHQRRSFLFIYHADDVKR